jgi:hypothetical protein
MQREQEVPDYFAICTCLVHLNDAESAAKDLLQLTKTGGHVLSSIQFILIVELLNSITNSI